MKKILLMSLAAAVLVVSGVSALEEKKDPKAPVKEKTVITLAPEYVGTETCATCHDKEYKKYKLSTHARIAVAGDDVKAQGCEMCHGPGSLHVDGGGGRGNHIINPRKDPSPCFTCHLDKKLEFRLPYHHPVLEGRVSCADCHNAHGEEIRPWTATTLDDKNEACFKCHKDKRGPYVWEHGAMREGCTVCHKVHGSIHDKLLIARDGNLCLRCHMRRENGALIGTNHSDLTRGSCWSGGCHSKPHGSNFSERLLF